MYREAAYLLETGVADVETIDRSFRNAFGLWASICGPFRWMDITGGPAAYALTLERVLPSLSNSAALSRVFQAMIDQDANGTGNGRGFYSYTKEETHKWEALFLEHAWRVRDLMNEYFPLGEEKS